MPRCTCPICDPEEKLRGWDRWGTVVAIVVVLVVAAALAATYGWVGS